MPQNVSDLGEIIVYGRRITFPFGTPPAGGGGGGPPLGDADSINPIEGPLEPLCADISFLSDADKEKYLIRYLSQKIADLIRNNPVQNREWGSAIWQDANGNFHFTSFIPTMTPQAQINWNDLPQINGQPDWSRVRGFIHSHPQLNLPLDPITGGEENYYDTTDPSYLLRPWDGD